DTKMENAVTAASASPIPPAKRALSEIDNVKSPQQQPQQQQPLLFKRLSDKARPPVRGSAGAVGYDLCSAADMSIPSQGKAIVPTDLAVAIPPGCYGRVAPRSGLAAKHFIDVGAGVVDPDYRGSVGVVLFNHAADDFKVSVGDRVAQLVLEMVATPPAVEVDELDATVRGAGGYGSTGMQ
ncbi:hypothetical protein BOX15_Mlig022808g1, partial [Macrostomum lignano]